MRGSPLPQGERAQLEPPRLRLLLLRVTTRAPHNRMAPTRGPTMSKIARRKFLQLAAGGAVLPATARLARARSYPTRPVTIIVPFAPGGGADVSARIAGEYMSRTLGQRFV